MTITLSYQFNLKQYYCPLLKGLITKTFGILYKFSCCFFIYFFFLSSHAFFIHTAIAYCMDAVNHKCGPALHMTSSREIIIFHTSVVGTCTTRPHYNLCWVGSMIRISKKKISSRGSPKGTQSKEKFQKTFILLLHDHEVIFSTTQSVFEWLHNYPKD